MTDKPDVKRGFPFLFGGTFIEAAVQDARLGYRVNDFPSFSEGLSLRLTLQDTSPPDWAKFPFLFGGTFIEADYKPFGR